MRGRILLAAWAALALACDAAELEEVQAPVLLEQPNFVVIMTDDLDVGSMQRMVDLGLAPNIERYLYRQGTRFSNFFVSNPLCCPSRATALSGQYSHNNGVYGVHPEEENGGVDAFDDTSTLVTWLQAVGYRTGHVGKYLNGYGTERDQTTPSFQDDYIPPGWSRWMATIGSGTYRMFRYKIHDSYDGVANIELHGYDGPATVADYQTTVLARKAVSFIAESEGPFYLEVMPVAPHAEALPREGQWDFFIRWDPQDDLDKPEAMALIDSLGLGSEGKPSYDFVTAEQPNFVRNRLPLSDEAKLNLLEYYRSRLKSMLAVDDLVGDVVAELEAKGVLENTVLFFTSDNGFLFGEHRLAGKRVAYDESTKVPLYIRVPARELVTTPRIAVNVDLAPTIAELAGAEPGLVIDGRSLVPFLAEEVPVERWRRRALLEHWQRKPSDVPTYAGVRTVKWLFVDYYESISGMHELYDLALDPYQTVNVYSDPNYEGTKNTLQGVVDAMRTCAGDECRALEE